MAMVVALALIDAFLAWMIYQTRRGVTRDSATDMAELRRWYELQYAHGGNEPDRANLEAALQRELHSKRWHPLIAAFGTMIIVLVTMIAFAWILTSQLAPLSHWSPRLILVVAKTMQQQLLLTSVLVPVTLIEEVVIVRNVADFDIGRLRRLLEAFA